MHQAHFNLVEQLFADLCDARIVYIEKNRLAAQGASNNYFTASQASLATLHEFWMFTGQEVSPAPPQAITSNPFLTHSPLSLTVRC
jgi:hypothetical protein